MANLTLKATFTLKDSFTRPMKAIREATAGAAKACSGLRDAARNLKGRLEDTAKSARKFVSENKKLKASLEGVHSGIQAAAVAGAATATLFGIGLVKGVFDTTAQFERYETILTTIEKSSTKAKSSMAWIQNFAATTPYELADVTDAFVKMRAYALDPTDGSLRILGDTAAAMGKPLMQAVEAIADAQTGEFERLKEFGIKAQSVGNKVSLTFGNTTVTTEKKAAALRRAVLGIFETNYSGAMNKLSATWDGLWSNLKDTVAKVQLSIGRAGIFDKVKADLSRFLAWFTDPKNQAAVEKWAKTISDALSQMYDGLKELFGAIDWTAVAKGIGDVAKGFAEFIRSVGGIGNVVKIGLGIWLGAVTIGFIAMVPALIAGATAIWGVVTAIGAFIVSAAIALAPILAVIAAVAALAAVVWLVIKNWDGIWSWFADMWVKVEKAFSDGVANVWNALPEWFRNVLKGAAFMVKLGWNASPAGMAVNAAKAVMSRGENRPAAAVGRVAGAGQAQVGGQIKVAVEDKRTRVTSVQSDNKNVPVIANTGLQGAS